MNSPHPTSDPSRYSTEPPIDGILSYVQTQSMAKSMKKQNQTASPASHSVVNPKTSFSPVVSIKVNAVQSVYSLGT